jgi:hypothetical protein
LARGSAGWRYLDSGQDQGTAWRGGTFSDALWASGTAPLGYPVGAPITTVISFGPNSTAKYTTSYFRRQFTVSDPAAYTDLQLEVLRDDGVVIYLNGTEAYRNNMPSGTISYGTTASTRVDAGAYLQTSLNRSLLVPGNNVIAAEVHQFDGASSDIVFDAVLNGLSLSNVTGLKLVYLSSPANESRLVAPSSVTLAANAFTSVGTVSLVEFFVDGTKVGEDSAVPYSVSWPSPSPGAHTLTAVATVSGDGTVTSPPVSVTILETPTPTVEITSPANGAGFLLPTNLTFEAKVAAAGQAIRAVKFFVDGELLTEDLTPPYSASLNQVVPGTRILQAVAETTTEETFESPLATITLAAPSLGTQLISFGATWSYLDDGSDQGTDWVQPGFNDRGWNAGPGRLGYGGDGELTAVTPGPAASRYVTIYFRKRFVVPDPSRFGRLLLRLLRDDGAVVYVNGVEVFRDNLLPGLVSYNSFAVAAIEGTGETIPLEVNLPRSVLIAGTNVVAVEIHQVNLTSTDLGFDLALVGLDPAPPADPFYLIQPAEGASFVAPARVTLAAYVSSLSAPDSVAYYADGGFLGFGTNTTAFPFAWVTPPQGSHALLAVVDWGGGVITTSAPVNIAVVARPSTIQPFSTTILPAGTSWRYWDSLTPVGSGWARTDFDDAAWPLASARFGWGLDGERTPLTEGRVTSYFRRSFSFINPGVVSELLFQLARDDGAVVYLNGAEIFRSNMPGGDVTSSTLALASVNPPEETMYFPTVISSSGSGFVDGNNLVAVELHQSSSSSSDAGFDLQIVLRGTTEARVYLTTPIAGASYSAAANVIPIEAIARGAAGVAVTNVEFFADGVKLGELDAAPWKILWNNAPIGEHFLTARSRDVSGLAVDSEPVSVSVGRTFVSTRLVPTNSVWKYLVTGVNQGTNWTTRGYNDSTWPSGVARLGFGGDGEATTIGFGGNPSSKFITTYFRKSFVVTSGAVYTDLIFTLLRDDGAVVWLNGLELFRSNMPSTPITYQTLASQTVSGTDEQTYFVTALPNTNLVSGTNILAVELHQAAPDSSDLGFNLELTAAGYLQEAALPRLSVVFTDGAVELSWPSTAAGYRVYEAPALETHAGAWTASVGSLVQLPGSFTLTISTPPGPRFYRLGKP